MKCANCRLNNPIDAVNCLRCGEKLVLKCDKCGAINPENTIFCIKCGYCYDQEADAIRLKPINKKSRKKFFVAIASAFGALAVGAGIFLGIAFFVKDTMYLDEPLTPVGCHPASGDMVEYYGWIYYSWEDGTYRISNDGVQTEKLSDCHVGDINVINGWIYYINNYVICKMKTDGSQQQSIENVNEDTFTGKASVYASKLMVAGDWIFYITDCETKYHYELHRIRTDGTHEARVVHGECSNFTIDDNWIYYQYKGEHDNRESMYRMRLDGSENEWLSYADYDLKYLVDGWIYDFGDSLGNEEFLASGMMRPYKEVFEKNLEYYDNSNEKLKKLAEDAIRATFDVNNLIIGYVDLSTTNKKINMAANEEEKLGEDVRYYTSAVYDGWLYYFDCLEQGFTIEKLPGSLYRIRTDGSDLMKIADDWSALNFSVVGNWIFYRSIIDGEYYMIRTDGTDKQLFSPAG